MVLISPVTRYHQHMTPEFIHHPTQFTFWMAILSVCVGSFITLLVYRLPLMSKDKSIGLFFPASFCPACKKPLKYWHNISKYGNRLLAMSQGEVVYEADVETKAALTREDLLQYCY